MCLGRREYTANLLTAHLPNDWCLHATSPEECLSQRHFLHLGNTQDPKADVTKDAHKQLGVPVEATGFISSFFFLMFIVFTFILSSPFPNSLPPPSVHSPAFSPQPLLLSLSLLPKTVLLLCCPINHTSLINRPTVPSLPTAPTPHLAQPCCPAGMQRPPIHTRIYAHSTYWSTAGN